MTRPLPFPASLVRFVLSAIFSLVATMAWQDFTAAQGLEKPTQNIDEDITAFAFAPDGKIAFAVHRGFKTKQYDLEHDDIWIQDAGGRRRRIFVGDKFTQANTVF